MKSQGSSLYFVVLAGVILLASYCATETKDVSADVNAANKSFMEAYNQGNANAVAANYTSNAKLFPANSEAIEGQSAIEGFWKSVMGMGITKVQLETVSADAGGDI